MPTAGVHDWPYVGWLPKDVRDDHGLGPSACRDKFIQRLDQKDWIKVPALLFAINESNLSTLIYDRISARYERAIRTENQIARTNTQDPQGEMNGCRTAAARDGVRAANILGERLFEPFYKWTDGTDVIAR
jgi:hypothetical protein